MLSWQVNEERDNERLENKMEYDLVPLLWKENLKDLPTLETLKVALALPVLYAMETPARVVRGVCTIMMVAAYSSS